MTTDTGDMTLLDAIEDLTKPDIHRETQDVIREGKVIGTQRVPVVLPPLLTQLDEAITSSMGGSTKGASLAFERDLLDTHALYEFIKIATQVRDWCRAIGVVPTKQPAQDLTSWYVKTLERGMDPDREAFFIRTLTGWAKMIRSKLDVWDERELPDECPVCGATEADHG